MAITDAQKVDLLYKKIGFGVSKTDTSAFKSPSNEANASPILTRGDTIWVESGLVPAIKPAANTSVIRLYQESLSSAIECTLDTTVSGTNRTWLTNYQDWIPAEFGPSYQVKVYAAPTGNASPETYGTQLFADGSGNSDAWYFDYQAGILNFPDTNVPSVVTGKKIYVIGARYVGLKGVGTLANLNIGNLSVDSITINNASILGGYLTNIANITATTGNIGTIYNQVLNVSLGANILNGFVGNFSTGNAVISGGYVSSLTNLTAITGNTISWYTTNLNSTAANVSTLYATNLSTANSLIAGGVINNVNLQANNFSTANALISGGVVYNTDIQANNFSTANALISGGVVYNTDIQANNFSTANALITGGDLSNLDAQIDNFSTANALISGGVVYNTNIQANNFSTGNALITSGNVTANITGNVTGTFGNFASNVNADWFLGNIEGVKANFSDLVFVNSNLTVSGNLISTTNLIATGNIITQKITSPTGDLHFSAATNDPNNIIRFDSVSAIDIPTGTTAQRPPSPDYGYVRYNTDQGSIEWWSGTEWVLGKPIIDSELITPDGSSDTFTLTQSTTENSILVNINGTIQQAGSGAYSVAGNQITFAEIPAVTDIIEIRYIAGAVAALTFDFANIASNVSPSANVTYDLGSSTNRWRDLWLAGNTIHLGAGTLSAADGNITITNPQGGSFKITGSESGNATATFGNVYSKAFYFANGTPFTSSTFGNVEVAAYLLENPQGNFYSNANVTAYIPTDATIIAMQANITAANLWIANAASQAQELITLTSNAASQADSLTSLLGNAAIQEANLALLVSNAASQQSSLNTINANIGAYQTFANANVVAIQANIGAYQTFANANAATQSTAITALRARAFTSVMVFGG